MSERKRIPLWIGSIGGLTILLLVLGTFAVPASGRGGIKTATPDQRLFDHERHSATVKIKCDRCHKATVDGEWELQGKKEHTRCFSCHKFSSSCGTLAKKEGRVCLACHTTFKSNCTPTGYDIPKLGNTEFSAQYSHRVHVRTRAKTGEQCETCHGEFGQGAPNNGNLAVGHALCSGCHARGVSPRINESCDGCHVAKGSAAVVSTRPANPYSVSGTFDHKAHANIGRVGTEGRDCLVCHSNIKTAASDTIVPLPTMDGCRSACHDGDKAFDAIGTSCTRCHTSGGR